MLIILVSLLSIVALLFLFSIYQMVDSMDTYKSISIGILVLEHSEMMKNPEILKFVPDHLKTKKKV